MSISFKDILFKRIIFQLIFVAIVFSANAQRFNYLKLGVKDGLPNSDITCLHKDATGNIWVGTREGIRKYNGQKFKSISQINGDKNVKTIKSICETNSYIWFASERTLSRVEGDFAQEFKFHTRNNPFLINKIIPVNDSVLFILSNSGVWTFKNNEFKQIFTTLKIDFENIICGAFIQSKNELWLGTEADGLFILDLKKNVLVNDKYNFTKQFNVKQISCIAQNAIGEIYIASKPQGVYVFRNNSLDELVGIDKKPFGLVNHIYFDNKDNLWLSTENQGAIKFNKSGISYFNTSNGLDENWVNQIVSDKVGNILFATPNNGVEVYSTDNYIIYDKVENLYDKNILNVSLLKTGELLIATKLGLSIYNGAGFSKIYKTDSLNSIRSIKAFSDEIFIGMNSGRMVSFNLTTQKVTNEFNLGKYAITSVNKFNEGKLLVGIENFGLFWLDSKTQELKLVSPVLNNSTVNVIEQTDIKTFYIGTTKGLFVLNDQKLLRLDDKNEILSGSNVTSIKHIDSKVLIGTSCCGLCIYNYNDKSFTFLTKADELLGNNIKSIFVKNNSSYLVSSSFGLNKINVEGGKYLVKKFGKDFLEDNAEFSFDALIEDDNSNVWAGSSSGLLNFASNYQRGNLEFPLQLNEILLYNINTKWNELGIDCDQKTGVPKQLVLKYNQNDISFEYGLNQVNTFGEIHYQYKIIGIDKDWVNAGNGTKAIYPSLPDGDYKFEVRASVDFLNWNKPLIYPFKIKTPFWKTLPFLGFIFLLIALLSILFLRNYKTYKEELISDSNIESYSFKTAKTVMSFGSFIIPFAGLMYAIFTEDYDVKLVLNIIIGVILIVIVALSSSVLVVRKNFVVYLKYAYYLVIANYILIDYISNLHPYYVAALILAISVGSTIFDKIRPFSIFAFFIFLATLFLIFVCDNQNYHRVLFGVAILSALFIALLVIIIKLNLIERLVFADTTINKGNSVVIASNQQGQIIFVSSNVKKLLGYESDELLGDGWWNVRSDNQIENKKVKKAVTEFKMERTVTEKIKTKKGDYRWIQWENSLLDSGVIVGIGMDVTEKRVIEERYMHIIESASDIIYTTDDKGKFTYVNDVALKLTGYTRTQLLSMNFVELVLPSHKRSIELYYAKQFRSSVNETYFEFPILNAFGEVKWFGQSVKILKDSSDSKKPVEFQAICREITERIKAELELKDNLQRLDNLNAIKQIILQSNSIDELSRQILKKIRVTNKDSERITLSYYNKSKSQNEVYRSSLNEPEIIFSEVKVTIKEEEEHIKAFEISNDLILHNLKAEDYPENSTERMIINYGIRSIARFAFKIKQNYFGTLNIFSKQENAFSNLDKFYYHEISSAITNFIQRVESTRIIEKQNEDIKYYNNKLEVINTIKHDIINAVSSKDIVYSIIMRFANKFSEYNKTRIIFFTDDKHNYLEYSYSEQDDRIIAHRGRTSLVREENYFDQGEYLLENNLHDALLTPKLDLLKQFASESDNSVLLLSSADSTEADVFIIVTSEKVNAFNQSDVVLLKDINQALKVGLEQVKYKREINLKNKQIQKYSNSLELLNEIKQSIIVSSNINDMIVLILESLERTLPECRRFSFTLFDIEKNEAILNELDSDGSILKSGYYASDWSTLSLLKQNKYGLRSISVKDKDLSETDRMNLSNGVTDYLVVPALLDGELICSVNFGSNDISIFDKNFIFMAQQVVEAFAITVSQIRSREIIEQKNQDITESISYAKRIQNAILPNENKITNSFTDSFLIFEPKQELSGDFYFYEKKENRIFIGVGDCTGHGVPGSLLSMISHNLLSQAVNEKKLIDSGSILDYLDKGILHSFNTGVVNENIKDGLDIGFIVIDTFKKVLSFSGAMHNLFVMVDENIFELKGNRAPIGPGIIDEAKGYYCSNVYLYKPGTKLFLCTDGYTDQFSSTTNRKFGKARLKQILLEYSDMPLTELGPKLKTIHTEWRGFETQTDDICMIGLQL